MSPVSRPIPPNPPWAPMSQEGDGGGCLSVYYSDDMSPLAVRWITKPGDNKSDPNLETMTYGLFSTCSKAMRSGIVKRGAEYLFFATRRGGTRVLSGSSRNDSPGTWRLGISLQRTQEHRLPRYGMRLHPTAGNVLNVMESSGIERYLSDAPNAGAWDL